MHLYYYFTKSYFSTDLSISATGVGRIFSRGGTRVFFQNFSRGWPKVVKFVYSVSNLRKQPFFAEIFKFQAGKVIFNERMYQNILIN